MTEAIIEKITRYNLFNILLPWVVFIVFLLWTTEYELAWDVWDSIILLLFLSYFLWLIISRLGSLIIEPIFKKCKIVKYASYSDYLKVLKKDNKLDSLSEENNSYRTYVSLFSILLLVHFVMYLIDFFDIHTDKLWIWIIIFFLVLFIFSYRKQTTYIKNRINNKK